MILLCVDPSFRDGFHKRVDRKLACRETWEFSSKFHWTTPRSNA